MHYRVVLLGVAVIVGAGGAAACSGGTRGPSPEPAVEEPGRVAVLVDPAATAVAAAFAFPGSGWELPGTEGLTLLTAETLLEQVRGPLEELGARADVTCDLALFTFTLVAPPDVWREALNVLLDGLFRPDPGAVALERARERVRRALSLDHASPAWQARLAARQALYGDTLSSSAWESPACGVPESLDLLDLPLVRAAAYRFAPRMTAGAALLGPVDGTGARQHVQARIPAGPPPLVPAPPSTAPGRRYVERNTITAWLSHSYPFEAGTDEEALHLLGSLLVRELGPDVSRPAVFATSYEVERHGGGGALIVYMVTTPGAAAEYGERLLHRVRAVAGEGVDGAVWAGVSRRHRGARLLERETPESRVAALAESLARGGGAGDGWPDPAPVTSERLRQAAAALGAPARAVVGPRSARSAALP